MKYRDLYGWKYQLLETHHERTPIKPVGQYEIDTDFIRLDLFGNLTVRAGYCWDGPSGPAVDTDNFMCPSLVHDALYQLIRMGKLPEAYKGQIDDHLKTMTKIRGMSSIRAWWVRTGVWFGKGAIKPREGDIIKVKEVF